jgi:hypothetical protein
MHYANTDLALDLALYHLILLLPTLLSSPWSLTYSTIRPQAISIARDAYFDACSSRVTCFIVLFRGEIRETHTFEPAFLTILDHPLQYLDRSVIPNYRDPASTHKNRIISTYLYNMVVRPMLLGINSDAAEAPV